MPQVGEVSRMRYKENAGKQNIQFSKMLISGRLNPEGDIF